MILIIPSIVLKNGQCSYCITGERGTSELYQGFSAHPGELCKLLRRENSKALFIHDYDSYNGNDNFDYILEYVKLIDIPIVLKAKFGSFEQCSRLLDNGIYRLITDDFDLSQPENINKLIKKYTSSRVGCYYQDNKEENDEIIGLDRKKFENFLNKVKNFGVDRVVYSCNNSDSDSKNPDFNDLMNYAIEWKVKITLENAIFNVQRLWELNRVVTSHSPTIYSIDSVIIGKPLYDNIFPCQKIWRLIESKLETTH